MIEATLTAGGWSRSKPVAYLIRVRCEKREWLYVGKTGSANGSGTSAAFERLAGHMKKAGSTQSALWDNSKRLSPATLQRSTVCFLAVTVPQRQSIKAEKWLLWRCQSYRLLNRMTPPSVEPEIGSTLKGALEKLVGALAG